MNQLYAVSESGSGPDSEFPPGGYLHCRRASLPFGQYEITHSFINWTTDDQ